MGAIRDTFYFNYSFLALILSFFFLLSVICLVLRVLFYKLGTFFQRVLLLASIILLLLNLIFYYPEYMSLGAVPFFILISLCLLPAKMEDPDYPKIISKFYFLSLLMAFIEIVALLFFIDHGVSLFLILALVSTIIFTITTLLD
jgi:hypothetical protein